MVLTQQENPYKRYSSIFKIELPERKSGLHNQSSISMHMPYQRGLGRRSLV